MTPLPLHPARKYEKEIITSRGLVPGGLGTRQQAACKLWVRGVTSRLCATVWLAHARGRQLTEDDSDEATRCKELESGVMLLRAPKTPEKKEAYTPARKDYIHIFLSSELIS